MIKFILIYFLFCGRIFAADVCEWTPASNVYTGTADAAINSFIDIPMQVREVLIEMANQRVPEYSDIVTIRRDSIAGRNEYLPDITQMHFGGKGHVCDTVTRTKWKDGDSQHAIAFCHEGYCIIRPAVCNNWARIRMRPAERITTEVIERFPTIQVERSATSSTFIAYRADSGDWGYVYSGVVPGSVPTGSGLLLYGVPQGPGYFIPGPIVVGPSVYVPGVPMVVTSTIPELATWGYLALGLAALALFAWRKR